MKTFPKLIKTNENKIDWFRIVVLAAFIAIAYQGWMTWNKVNTIMTSGFRAELYAEKSYDKANDAYEKLFDMEKQINEVGADASNAFSAAEKARKSAAFCEG